MLQSSEQRSHFPSIFQDSKRPTMQSFPGLSTRTLHPNRGDFDGFGEFRTKILLNISLTDVGRYTGTYGYARKKAMQLGVQMACFALP